MGLRPAPRESSAARRHVVCECVCDDGACVWVCVCDDGACMCVGVSGVCMCECV